MLSHTSIITSNKFIAVPIDIKLNDTNYEIWSQVADMYVSGKNKIGYINGDLPFNYLIQDHILYINTSL